MWRFALHVTFICLLLGKPLRRRGPYSSTPQPISPTTASLRSSGGGFIDAGRHRYRASLVPSFGKVLDPI